MCVCGWSEGPQNSISLSLNVPLYTTASGNFTFCILGINLVANDRAMTLFTGPSPLPLASIDMRVCTPHYRDVGMGCKTLTGLGINLKN